MGILSGHTVIDLSRFLPGPYCSMILADHGARVVAVEDRRFEKEALPYLKHLFRNKEHMALNLKSPAGREVFLRLVKKADVVLEGFRPGVMDRLGLGYPQLREIRPDIIYCALTGYGQTGPLKDKAGHDINFISESGVLSLIGPKGSPPVIPAVQLGDIVGALNGVVGVLLALAQREKTGEGGFLDISMTDALIGILPLAAGWFWKYGKLPERGDFIFSHRYAFYNVYQAADGGYIAIGSLERRFWEALCRLFDVAEFIPLQFDEARQAEMIEFFRNAFLKKTRDKWIRDFAKHDLCISGVMNLDEVLSGPLARDRQMVLAQACGDPSDGPVLGMSVKFPEPRHPVRKPPPRFGQNTRTILKELGYSDDEVYRMIENGDAQNGA
jgi:crotonobetainyl-CoA:carnitine CoA-transferase CaiB-like acyl-CoA transferase